jgi:hypothetical protein
MNQPVAPPHEPGAAGCENCGFPDPDLVRTHRVYVTPASWDTEGSETVVPEPEMWCVSCCSQYPNEPVDHDGDSR